MKLRVEDATDWAQIVLDDLTGTDLTVTAAAGRGSVNSKGYKIKLRVKGTREDGRRLRAKITLSSMTIRVLAQRAAEMSPDGGAVELDADTQILTDSGFFTAPTDVDAAYQRSPSSLPVGAKAVGDTLAVTFPVEAVAIPTEAGASAPAIRLRQPTVATRAVAIAKRPDGSTGVTLRRLALNALDNAGSTLAVVSLYPASSNEVAIPADSLQGLPPNTMAVRAELTDTFFPDFGVHVDTALYHWGEINQRFNPVTDASGVVPGTESGETLVVLLHGWQPFSDWEIRTPHIDTWQSILEWATDDRPGGNFQAVQNRAQYEFYSIRYDTTLSVYDNAVAVHNLLATAFRGRRVTILAHSMGGLVSHAMYQRYHPDFGAMAYNPWTDGGIDRIVALDTPFHGTPIVQVLRQQAECDVGFDIASTVLFDAYTAYLLVATAGAGDLAWDGSDGALASVRNEDLYRLNSGPLASLTSYRTFGNARDAQTTMRPFLRGSLLSSLYGKADRCLRGISTAYASDGVVPLTSSHLRELADGGTPRTIEVPMSGPGGYTNNFDHTQVWEGRFAPAGDPQHFNTILAQLRPGLPDGLVFVSSFDCDFTPCSGSRLFQSDLAETGTDLSVGTVASPAGTPVGLTDIAISPGGALYGVSTSMLYRVSTSSGIADLVGATSGAAVNALAFSPQGELYGGTDSGSLVAIDASTGVVQTIGQFGTAGGTLALGTEGDLAFAPDGRLFALLTDRRSTSGVLATVNTTTGGATRVGTEPVGFERVFGLHFYGSQLFGFTSVLGEDYGALIEIDIVSGRGTFVRWLSFSAGGA